MTWRTPESDALHRDEMTEERTTINAALAERLGAEIVALDSMTLYRGMDVGTAKPDLMAQARVPHHLLDVLDGPLRNAVVQGLGSLGMPAGSEVSVPLSGAAPISLRREASGHVRVTLTAR